MEDQPLVQKAKTLRKQVLQLAYDRGGGHIGGALSIVEILLSLYEKVLKEEDKFILSKGHGCLPYFILLKEKGYNPNIAGHPEIDPENGIYCTTGSLGHGLPTGVGMALARKKTNTPGKIYVLMSDAECQEGTTWESSLLASHYKLDNLTAIVDNNKLQTLGITNEILSLHDLQEKFEAFGWQTSIINGHSFEEIIQSLNQTTENKPRLIIANTTKGKGISFMEGVSKWHTMIPTEEELNQAYKELE
jgi:transketolase